MFKCHFNNVDELKEFLKNSEFDEVKFCVDPDYIEAIIGLGDDGKLVYDYNKMVEHLANIYRQEPNCDDPYLDASEWIDYNCDIPYWHIANTFDEELEMEYPKLYTEFSRDAIIGEDTYGNILLDSEQDTIDIQEYLDKEEIPYNVI